MLTYTYAIGRNQNKFVILIGYLCIPDSRKFACQVIVDCPMRVVQMFSRFCVLTEYGDWQSLTRSWNISSVKWSNSLRLLLGVHLLSAGMFSQVPLTFPLLWGSGTLDAPLGCITLGPIRLWVGLNYGLHHPSGSFNKPQIYGSHNLVDADRRLIAHFLTGATNSSLIEFQVWREVLIHSSRLYTWYELFTWLRFIYILDILDWPDLPENLHMFSTYGRDTSGKQTGVEGIVVPFNRSPPDLDS